MQYLYTYLATCVIALWLHFMSGKFYANVLVDIVGERADNKAKKPFQAMTMIDLVLHMAAFTSSTINIFIFPCIHHLENCRCLTRSSTARVVPKRGLLQHQIQFQSQFQITMVTMLLFTGIIPLLVLIVLNTRIYCAIRTRTQKLQSMSSKQRR